MRIYRLLKIFTSINSPRIRLLGLWFISKIGKRYVGVFLDPVIACNLRCRMCYFSGSKGFEMKKERISIEQIDKIAKSIFKKALKVQIGCGGEPTLYNNLPYIVKVARKYNVPYISLTTNGNILSKEVLEDLVASGLNEITISAHGVKKETYEYFMQNARYDRFMRLLCNLKEIKRKNSDFRIRINYTINEDNFDDLKSFWDIFGDLKFDILQLRPIQNIGDCAYGNYKLDKVKEQFSVITDLVEECKRKGIITLAPEKVNLDNIDVVSKFETVGNTMFEKIAHCYVFPNGCNDGDFDYENETIVQYHNRVGVWKELWKIVLSGKNKKMKESKTITKMFNYK